MCFPLAGSAGLIFGYPFDTIKVCWRLHVIAWSLTYVDWRRDIVYTTYFGISWALIEFVPGQFESASCVRFCLDVDIPMQWMKRNTVLLYSSIMCVHACVYARMLVCIHVRVLHCVCVLAGSWQFFWVLAAWSHEHYILTICLVFLLRS